MNSCLQHLHTGQIVHLSIDYRGIKNDPVSLQSFLLGRFSIPMSLSRETLSISIFMPLIHGNCLSLRYHKDKKLGFCSLLLQLPLGRSSSELCVSFPEPSHIYACKKWATALLGTPQQINRGKREKLSTVS